jgi:hypothetical protein
MFIKNSIDFFDFNLKCFPSKYSAWRRPEFTTQTLPEPYMFLY